MIKNMIKNIILEIHGIEEVECKLGSGTFIMVDITIKTCGEIKRIKTSFSDLNEWNAVKEDGYYLS